VATQASVAVRDAFRDWEPGVELVKAEADLPDSDGNIAAVNVEYRRLDAADSGTSANTNQAIISANGTVREVVRG
jgi:phage baseplate assembly protein W